MTKYDKAVSVCFSGHRSVPFAKRRELKQCLKSEIAKAYADGYRYFYCGMAMGFDLLAAEAALFSCARSLRTSCARRRTCPSP
jgi:hypothetical protein